MGATIRSSSVVAVTIPNGAALSQAISMHDYASGMIIMPAAWTAAALSFKVCDSQGGTFVPLKVAAGTVCELTVAANVAFALPADLASVAYFKLWSETGSSDVTQGADRNMILVLKS
jgi:hypothetical protein